MAAAIHNAQRKDLEWHFEGDCIRCTSHAATPKGYPERRRNGIKRTIARHIVLKRHGPLSRDVQSRHTCDNSWCINPAHLLIGSNADNVADKVQRGRQARVKGVQNGHAKFDEIDILAIRESRETQRKLAEYYGVTQSAISRVKTMKRWGHL